MRHFILFLILGFITSCASVEKETGQEGLLLVPASFRDLQGWDKDRQQDALIALERSCARILKRAPTESFGAPPVGGTYGDWQPACRALPISTTSEQARDFFERWFTPWQAFAEDGKKEGLFTGYYEPELHGSRIKTGTYIYPLYKKPDDLVMVDLGAFREELKGQRIAGRVHDSYLKPYEDRQKISEGHWPHNDKVLVWVDNPVDSFFLHIQGSGRVSFKDGSSIHVGYDGQNGHIYYAIGRELIKRGILDKDEVSLQSIRHWLETHPKEAPELMNLNKSYVFFKEIENKAPLGGENVPLTPERSLAIDRSKIPYGIPVWVDIEPPVENTKPLRQLMVAQDTGGAIQGAVRGDFFWGHGEKAAYFAGHMKAKGQYWFLLPKK